MKGRLYTTFIFTTFFFMAQAQQWIEAGYLQPGTMLQNAQGETLAIATVEISSEETEVYNMEVKDWHTYYAGNSAVLTHNYDKLEFSKNCSEWEKQKAQFDFNSVVAFLGDNPNIGNVTISCSISATFADFNADTKLNPKTGKIDATIEYGPSIFSVFTKNNQRCFESPRSTLSHEWFHVLQHAGEPGLVSRYAANPLRYENDATRAQGSYMKSMGQQVCRNYYSDFDTLCFWDKAASGRCIPQP